VSKSESPKTKQITINSANLTVEIADTAVLQLRGLSYRDMLKEDYGMLFIYPEKKIREFWMKSMLFNLDVLWISDNRVVGLQENIPFESPKVDVVRFKPDVAVDMVLEVNAGWIFENNINIGDILSFS
jgi:hypothetical protein